MSTLKVNAVIDASGGNTATINSMTPTADSLQGFRNRIINGDMRIDQRNAGAAVSTDNSFPIDRFNFRTVGGGVISFQQNSTVPTGSGFVNSLALTVTTADASIAASDNYQLRQNIEGTNVADLGFGSASAKTVTISFWVRSSLTGTFGGNIINSAGNRSYVFQYTISAANTWEQKTITIPGDTTGTWLTTTGIGIILTWDLGSGTDFNGTANVWNAANNRRASGNVQLVGTLNATWYVTGVQLEVGSVATPFERRPYGEMLMLCQRYYYRVSPGALVRVGCGYVNTTTAADVLINFPTVMRIAPTALEQSGTAADYDVAHQNTATTCSAVPSFRATSQYAADVLYTVASGLTVGDGIHGRVGVSGYLGWSAEL